MKKLAKIITLALIAVLLVGTVQVFAYESYETYTYSIDGTPLKSPKAYDAIPAIDSLSMGIYNLTPDKPNLSSAQDVFADEKGNVYIADTGNKRIVILDKYYTATNVIDSYVDESRKTQTFMEPTGIYVTDPNKTANGESYIYVCDKGKIDADNPEKSVPGRIVIFDRDFNYIKTLERPDTPLLTNTSFTPTAIAVDIYGRIFVTSPACLEGVIVLSSEGDFTGFIGVQTVSYSIIELVWRNFQSKEQRESSIKKLANPYNNITVDDDGFVYVTTNSTDKEDQSKQFASLRNPSASDSPVKKLNSAGKEIMKRNGFFDPAGEVDVSSTSVSQIIDVAVGEEGSWSILDQTRSRIFTYDQGGNLLFAFGGLGDQMGNGESFVSMTYQKIGNSNKLLLLDNASGGYKLNVYSPTEYHATIMSALRNANEHNYDEAISFWQEVLTKNNNFDLAYIGIGKALFNQGKYEEAQEMLANAYETDYHDKAFTELRKAIVQKWLLLIVAAAIALAVLVVKFFGFAKKRNKATSLKVGRKTYGEELLFAAHLVFHPFDGFWDLKHEKRGSIRGALTIMGVTILAFFYQAIGRGYSFNPRGDYSTVFVEVIAVVVPVLLWCVGNWCLTTLFDGEGSFRDIIIATGYSLTPLPIFVIISTVMTNLMTSSEGSMVSLLVTIGYIWVGILLFFGMLVTHDYSMNKNFITVLGTIVAMAIIMFVAILFSTLVTKMVTFIISIFTEIGNRI